MKRIIAVYIISSLILSVLVCCSSEDTKIMKALKETIPTESLKHYKHVSHQIVSTTLRQGVEDSISTIGLDNMLLEQSMKRKMDRRNSILHDINDAKDQQRNTMYWLRGFYNNAISGFEDLLEDINQEIAQDSIAIIMNNDNINHFQDILNNTDSPILFYKVKHEYKLAGAYRSDVITLDHNYNIVQ